MKKLKLLCILLIITLFFISNKSQAKSEELQILKKSDTEYIIYLENNLQTEFEFAFSNNKNVKDDDLEYILCGKDNKNFKNANSIVYIDSNIYNKYFSDETYLWVRDMEKQYLIKNLQIDLNKSVEKSDFNKINNITKIIKVETQKSVITKYVENEVQISKTVGKVDILEDGITYYKLIKLPNNYEYNELIKLIKQMENSNTNIDIYSKLKLVSKFKELFNKSTRKWMETS